MVGRLGIDIRISSAMAVAAARCRHACVGIRRDQRQPGKSGPVTCITGLAGRDVRSRFAACIDVVMAINATTCHDPGVRKVCGSPGACRVTGVAGLGGRNMGGILDLCILCDVSTVMASCTVPGSNRTCCTGVTHCRRSKRRIVFVAGIALRRSGYMD